MKRKSYAKINLFLKITNYKAPYHQLESVMSCIDLHDELDVKKSDKLSFEIDGEFASLLNEEKNIFIDIIDYFVEKFNISRNLEIKLKKNIPIGAGLGGGSSNGAEFMKILNEIFDLKLSKNELQKISLNFGSDIAFFFEEKASLIRGRGDIIKNLEQDFEDLDVIIVNPKIELSTKKVFDKFHEDNLEFSAESSDEEIFSKNLTELLQEKNDLTAPASGICKEISEIITELKNCGAKIAKMSGSGATCFAVFADSNINEALKKISMKFTQYYIKKTRILAKI